MGSTHLLALTSLITSAVEDLISSQHPIPPLNSVDPTPFDATGPELLSSNVTRAIATIEAACTQLICTVSNPGSVLLTKSLAHEESACLSLVVETKVADFLVDKPEGVNVEELAKNTGIKDAGKLGRIMRLLATRHVFREVKPGVFANNRLSAKLVSNNPTSDIVSLLTGESLLASAHLGETLATTYEGPEIPFERATGHAFFDYYKTEKGKKQGARFPRAMIGWGDITGKGFLQKVYPWTSLPLDTTVCDIGGGNGHVTMGLMRAHPHLKVVLQDQPQVIEQAKSFWKEHHPEALEAQRIEYVPFDFFKDAAAEGCDVYYIRSVLRDWPDEESLRILENVRKAMSPNSRLIIHDTVLRPSTSGSAPSPLLPNWGAAKARTYEMDLIMMNLLGAKARTLDEFKALCEKANLKYERLYEAGETDLVEFIPV
ncbi:S-adenosyl-L-methionine-dependent methyltransferase [Moniliophthora roreri MCA 2997]|uniref:S-adenosyl-L-methionine-dependent methyltransferase n=1 Tax=Moniliophthora roreri (strain MCA 2997) TaxID=1381753 RepID=V2WVQ0_MONRO|nr:S-adenosyl-L-methionine-dependent methyltransferase [Moniliophthora roreri MCA 2997]